MYKKSLFIFFSIVSFSSFSEKDIKGNIIINNEANSLSNNNNSENIIKAPALVPSSSNQLRELRKSQEIETEDSILLELEKQRISDEKARFNKLFSKEAPSSKANLLHSESSESNSFLKRNPFFGEKSFISLGAGVIFHPYVKNVNSTEFPTLIVSLGNYTYNEQIIFNLIAFYSTHYLKESSKIFQNTDIRERVQEPAIAMDIKWSLLKGKTKPYIGLTGALFARKWSLVDRLGSSDLTNQQRVIYKDVGNKNFLISLNGGLVLGADIILEKNLGLNVDIRYYVNFYTENRKTLSQYLTSEAILDEVDVILSSIKLKYFF
ncbi:MAG: hypothetical protein GDA46_01805 [Bdellovibrionales bacterium]|nr:hypothetical protein [Bdellovibrionales bacterium]